MFKKLLYTLICTFSLIGCTDETKVQSVHLNPTELTLNIGDTRQIEMLINPISSIIYNPVAWHSSNPNVAQVDNKGNVTAIYVGECIITGKTKHHEDYCHVTVVAPKYKLSFTNGIMFDDGIKPETNQRNLILRLYDDNLTIDSTGAMSGNGTFLNINLYAPANSEQLPIGEYHISDTINDFTITPGTLHQEGNAYYATGSYLGQYTDNGLSALFLTEGNIAVENNSSYSITCSFIGSKNEIVDATFNGSIDIYDTSYENKTTTIEYTNATTESVEIVEEQTLNHIKIALTNNDTTVTFIARTPKSITTLPLGNYYLNNNTIAYTLVDGQCTISNKETSSNITNATLQISETKFQAKFTDDKGTQYQLRPAQKNENIRKQILKSFAY